jgi:hypothetical protein
MYIDGIQRVGVSGPGIPAGEYNLVELLLTDEELAEYRAGYDPSSSSSPSAAACRKIARLVLDATASDQAPAEMREVT